MRYYEMLESPELMDDKDLKMYRLYNCIGVLLFIIEILALLIIIK